MLQWALPDWQLLAPVLALLLTMALADPATLYTAQSGVGAFFRVVPYWLIITLAGGSFGFALLAMGQGARRYWRGTAQKPITSPAPVAEAAFDILTLRNLGGGGHGWRRLQAVAALAD